MNFYTLWKKRRAIHLLRTVISQNVSFFLIFYFLESSFNMLMHGFCNCMRDTLEQLGIPMYPRLKKKKYKNMIFFSIFSCLLVSVLNNLWFRFRALIYDTVGRLRNSL